jgi:hypothetical protein
MKLIQEQSKGEEIIFASFFFWNSSVRAQMTQDSLLRSLLFRTLRQFPELISIVLREQINVTSNSLLKNGGLHWSIPQLKKAFERLKRQREFRIKFSITIDGLDEYDGNQHELTT